MKKRECNITLDDDNFVTFVTAKLSRILSTDYRQDHHEQTQDLERLATDLIVITNLVTEYLKITKEKDKSTRESKL